MKYLLALSASMLCWTFTVAGSEFQVVGVFKDHCVKCHGLNEEVEGEVDLRSIRTNADLKAHPELVEELVEVLRDRRMPPEDEPQPSDELRQSAIGQLQSILAETLKTQPFPPTPLRRMNRFQYNNAVVDLLDLDRDLFQMNERLMRRREDYFHPESGKMPDKVRVSCRPLAKDIDNQRPEGFRGVAAFPQDQRAEHGFDNRADHLTLSPLLMESFLKLSQTVVESPDLNPKECGVWDRVFAEPEGESLDRKAVVRRRLEPLLRRAFRRPVSKESLDRFVSFAVAQLEKGNSFEQTMRSVVGIVLGMPEFLYIYEDANGEGIKGRQRINDFELATRLSQLFWNSIPDDVLLDLAAAGELSKPEVLSTQIDRMMNDARSARFCENFASQWLQLDRLVTSIPDPEKFGYFYYDGYRSSMHMMSEPLLLFETIFVEDRSIMEFVDSDFTWESEMLKANYAGNAKANSEVQVQTFRRVSLDDPRRGGMITNAAVMTMTSTPVRTQPITRGAWVNAVIFNDPPEPPPADVPPLPENDHEALAKMTIRERLAAHRERADCAGCHDKIDPLGFALENFGPTGVWRDAYENGRDVDVSGELFNQHDFKTIEEFKHLIVEEKPRFIRAFLSHLLSYALGRELGPADSLALDEMTEAATNNGDTLRAVLKRVAVSEPFLHKNTTSD